jgi:hypothetical protein
MNLNELAVEVARREAGKKEVNIAQIKEIIKHLSIIMFEDSSATVAMLRNGEKHCEKAVPKAMRKRRK